MEHVMPWRLGRFAEFSIALCLQTRCEHNHWTKEVTRYLMTTVIIID